MTWIFSYWCVKKLFFIIFIRFGWNDIVGTNEKQNVAQNIKNSKKYVFSEWQIEKSPQLRERKLQLFILVSFQQLLYCSCRDCVVLLLLTFWCNDSTMCGKLANWNNTKKMSWEERCCHNSWLVPPISASKCSSLSERSMAYTTRSTSCSSSTGHRCFCWQSRRAVLKDKQK